MVFEKPKIMHVYINDEVRKKHFWEAIAEANLKFTLASAKGDTITKKWN